MSSTKPVLLDETSIQREADLKLLVKRNIDKNLLIGQIVKEGLLDKLWDELSRREFRDMFEAVAVVIIAQAEASHRVHARYGEVSHSICIYGQTMRAQQDPVDRKRERGRCGSFE